MAKDCQKSKGSFILIVIIISGVFILFNVNLKQFFESRQVRENIAYIKSGALKLWTSFSTSTAFQQMNTQLPINSSGQLNNNYIFSAFDPNSIGNAFNVPIFNPNLLPQLPTQSQNIPPPTN